MKEQPKYQLDFRYKTGYGYEHVIDFTTSDIEEVGKCLAKYTSKYGKLQAIGFKFIECPVCGKCPVCGERK